MRKSIKSILKEANRYEEVLELLFHVLKKADRGGKFWVITFVDDNGRWNNYVSADAVKADTLKLLEIIINNREIDIKYNLRNLGRYLNSETGTLLYNYANSLTHRETPDLSIDELRVWQIAANLLMCWANEESDWDIPKGWKKEV